MSETVGVMEYRCYKCNNSIPITQFHDCEGVHDLERYLNGRAARSARKRLRKKGLIT